MLLLWVWIAQLDVDRAITANVLLEDGRIITVSSVFLEGAIKGYHVSMNRSGKDTLYNIFNLLFIERVENSNEFLIGTRNGELATGRLQFFKLRGIDPLNDQGYLTVAMRDIRRIQLLVPPVTRYCAICDFEETTAEVICPICSALLEYGEETDLPPESVDAPPIYRLRIDESSPPRNN